ncbi:LOW QUALITY PROTEIN: inositol 1,4,5-triphosphate receptor associated 1 [Phycodurus eques]|uniref:LOW QUALITY PROTEIN: inositol 1,4,5-triphosphate receptor associated 1 n=1 Tax=Phycodurus eques TaxID=693459 RepID=UPI002ACD2EE7|nr:LOW QUALITY PROTEIN: inositol 1,4,5-triphosphate receptor associated 1 [Phycodurus eques]
MNGDAERDSSGKSSANSTAEGNFFFPLTRSRPCPLPAMPALPEEEEDSPEDPDSSSSSPGTCAPAESGAVVMTGPTIIYPQQTDVVRRDARPREPARPHSPRARLARNSSAGSITTVDSTGHVIDLVKDTLPEMRLSEEDRQKNLELLEEAKKVSDRFLMRRGRRSTSSLSDSPAAVEVPEVTCSPHSISQHLDVASARGQKDVEGSRLAGDWKPTEKRKVSSGTLTPRFAIPKENRDPKSPPGANKSEDGGRNSSQAPATGVAKPVPRPPTQQAPCTAEIKTIGAFPPLMRAVSWDAVRGINSRNGTDETSSDKGAFKAAGLKELPAPKLSKFREEHKLMRNQSKLPDLSEAAEQEKGPASASNAPPSSGETKPDAMPNISDVMLRKLKLHRGLPGCAPPLTEKEVENAFVQLSLAFRNDNYTLETRLKQAERERNLTEEDTQKELEEFKGALQMSAPQWQNLEQREAYRRLVETLAVLRRLAARLSSRSEIVGAVRQEKRMSKATEVMMQYVENLKRTYEKDHAELTEFKKLANQNSNRCYGSSVETGDDGVSRASRSMSLTLGKALPRRRVSVAVVPKLNLLNIPGQTPPAAAPNAPSAPTPGAALPALSEASDAKGNSSPESTQQATTERGKSAPEQEGESAKPAVNLEEIRAEIRAELKAKIEEEAYNKGYREGLKQNEAIREEKREEEEDAADKLPESKISDEESGKKIKTSRRMEELLVLLSRICPKVLWRKQLLWVALVVFLVMCLVISVFTFFTGYDNKRDDT